MIITFNAEEHSYLLNGEPVPSVTEIINVALDGNRKIKYPEGSAERGRNVHLACEYDDMDDLSDETLAPALRGYVAAWRAFKADYSPAWRGIEAVVGSERHRFAGTLDRLAALDCGLTLLDIKSGRASSKHRLQTAAYALAYEEATGIFVARRGCIYVDAAGNYSPVWHDDDDDDRETFLACRRLYEWRKRWAS